MRRISAVSSVGALVGVALALGPASAHADVVNVGADLRLSARAVVPVNVSSATLTVRPTTVGPVHHDGQVFPTGGISAGSVISVDVNVHGQATAGGTVLVTTSSPATAVVLTDSRNAEGQRCLGLGVDFVADVTVGAGASLSTSGTATATSELTINIGDVVYDWRSITVPLNHGAPIPAGGHHESLPVQTGADLCLPVEAEVAVETVVAATTNVVAGIKLG